jgi:hypothetical protein
MVNGVGSITETSTTTEPTTDRDVLMAATGVRSFCEAEFERAVAEVAASGSFLGRGDGSEFLSEVTRWRRFFTSSSLYGHRLGEGVSILSRYPFAEHDDLLVADRSRVTRNGVRGADSTDRVREAKARGATVIAFFGGSTVQGYGARLPEYTIPAQVERILGVRHGVDAVCLNYGLAGWTCVESLHLLIHEVSAVADAAVFYDGWNCCNELFLRELVARGRLAGPTLPAVFPGTSLRHVEQDFVGGLHYQARHLVVRSFRLAMNRLFTAFASCARQSAIRRFLNRLLQRYFTLVDRRLLREPLDRVSLTPEDEGEVVRQVADEYLRTHDKIARWCDACGIRRVHAFQPLLPNSAKVLTPREESFRRSGLPWGRPHVPVLFREAVRDRTGMADLSGVLDEVQEEVFVDAGHLNMRGNFYVAVRLADLLARGVGSARGGGRD